jgi:hypothetical protein
VIVDVPDQIGILAILVIEKKSVEEDISGFAEIRRAIWRTESLHYL